MELVSWADPDILQVLRLPAVAGDANGPLPADGIVLTQRMARKFFGRDNPVGEVLDIDRQHPMVVTAVLRDLPSNTHLNTEIIASGKAAFTGLARIDAVVGPDAGIRTNVYTYLRLTRPEAIAGVEQGLADFAERICASSIRA